ncbi:hypothetical protein QM467_03290 [Rhodoblastus sp. 17X3]|uniref:hypothetical protein n=1 Tax=Rhodoblastus sp. 17X3 TaxID=3047026 RepID=UPI0024B7AE1A|nr:hypothetical protein [Rhodoblastus sp. 17X3]MDI9847083.1 hypothetical protein [Rhodoblastus sp. 17X3]
MLLFHSGGQAGTKLDRIGMGPDSRHLSHHHTARLALDVAIVVGAILLWALLSHVNWSGLGKSTVAGDCVYYGRAGARCTEHVESTQGDKSAQDRGCDVLGRAGRICWPEPSSK